LFKIANEQTTFKESFNLSNNVLMHGVQSVTDLMVRPGIINLDFADVETVMASMGKAMMGTGESEGEGRAMKAAEMAISNPLIDDYTLKGAKGLLVNITGGEDLKLFEVDEVVNKIRSEVDVEAEVIIGAITDPSLDGKIRVSIVATSLDGQQPEAKSVINMVHRIQNRNPGYSDFSNIGPTPSFNFSTNNSSPMSHGANALKLENEVTSENLTESVVQEDVNQVNNQYHEELLKNQQTESIVENTSNKEEVSFTEETTQENETLMDEENTNNDLSEFGVDSDAPDLFNSESEFSNSSDLLSSENNDQEDDLEIPAFLRRQKN
jgi:cell division protein FtsZ